ncbi:hypothetical protein [Mesorhizobium sp. A623]
MQTWLDWYASQCLAPYRRASERSKIDGTGMLPDLDNPGVAFCWSCERAGRFLYNNVEPTRNTGWQERMLEKGIPYAIWEACGFQGIHVLPFASTRWNGAAPLAAALDTDAVHDLAEANITDDIRDLGRTTVEEYSRVYLDLPHRAYMLGDTNVQLRALFVMPNAHQGKATFVAVFTAADSNHGVRLIWNEGEEPVGAPEIRDGIADGFFEGSLDVLGGNDSLFDAALREDKLVLSDVLSDLEDFTWLTVAYLQTEEENRPAPLERLPYVAADDPRRGGRKARQVAKKFSLFSILKVTGTTVERDPSDKEPSSRQIGRRHQVRGHFKLQAFGPGHSKRRVRWIAPFMRGDASSTPVTPIRILRSANDNGWGDEAA